MLRWFVASLSVPGLGSPTVRISDSLRVSRLCASLVLLSRVFDSWCSQLEFGEWLSWTGPSSELVATHVTLTGST